MHELNYHSHGLGAFTAGLFVSSDWAWDVGENTSLSNGGVVKKLVELFVVADGQQNVSGHNSGLFVVLSSVSSQLKNLSSEILKDCSQVNWGSSSDSFGIVSMSQKSANSSDWELESCSWGLGHSLVWGSFSFSWFSSFSCHFKFAL